MNDAAILGVYQAVVNCTRCPLHTLRGDGGHAVPAELGSAADDLLLGFLAEAPGAQENATGKPLVGPAGKMFGKLLAGGGVSRESVLLMNTVRCRPPHNALSSHGYAIEACNDWTIAEFKVYDPKVVVLMGKTAIMRVFPGADIKVGEVRGSARSTGPEHQYGARVWVPTYHPAALTRSHNAELIKLVSEDIRLAATLLGEVNGE